MGMRNRRRGVPQWACLGCGVGMWREVAAAGRIVADRKRPGAGVIVHICGKCKTLHMETQGGQLRLLTAAERFRIEMEHGSTLRQIEATQYAASSTPVGHLVFPEAGR